MKWPKYDQIVGSAVALAALLAVIVAALAFRSEQALGACISLVSVAGGYYLRGRVDAASNRQDS